MCPGRDIIAALRTGDGHKTLFYALRAVDEHSADAAESVIASSFSVRSARAFWNDCAERTLNEYRHLHFPPPLATFAA
jgi:hypothetical protein